MRYTINHTLKYTQKRSLCEYEEESRALTDRNFIVLKIRLFLRDRHKYRNSGVSILLLYYYVWIRIESHFISNMIPDQQIIIKRKWSNDRSPYKLYKEAGNCQYHAYI